MITDQRLSGDADFLAMVTDLERSGLQVQVDGGTLPDVPAETTTDAAERARRFRPDVVVGVGGGSCLDMAKCVALLLRHGGQPQDYYGELQVPGPIVPLIAIPTTAGTGSEVTPVAVLSDHQRNLKIGVSSPYLIPTVATPELTQERVFIGKNAISDHFALTAISLLWQGLEAAYTDGNDLAARSQVMQGATFAGLAFAVAGTAAAHAIQYPVGALTQTAHGAGVACLMPWVMAWNQPLIGKELEQMADAMGLPAAEAVIPEISGLFTRIGIPRTLAQLGLQEDRLDWVAEQSCGIARLIQNNPRPLDRRDMRKLLDAAFFGDVGMLQ